METGELTCYLTRLPSSCKAADQRRATRRRRLEDSCEPLAVQRLTRYQRDLAYSTTLHAHISRVPKSHRKCLSRWRATPTPNSPSTDRAKR